jgi:hypothetical protein
MLEKGMVALKNLKKFAFFCNCPPLGKFEG